MLKWIIGGLAIYLATRQDPKAEGGSEFVGPPSSAAGGSGVAYPGGSATFNESAGASDSWLNTNPQKPPAANYAWGPQADDDDRRVWLLVGADIAGGRASVHTAAARVGVEVTLLETSKVGSDVWMLVRILNEDVTAAKAQLAKSTEFTIGGAPGSA